MHITEEAQARFWSKVALPNGEGCMLWLAGKDVGGYGQLKLNGKYARAHRISYTLAYGPMPDGLVTDHLCRVRHCVAPDHLEAVTNAENIRRGQPGIHHKIKTHCMHGHAFDGGNTYVTSDGRRRCRACRRGWSRDYRLRQAQAQ